MRFLSTIAIQSVQSRRSSFGRTILAGFVAVLLSIAPARCIGFETIHIADTTVTLHGIHFDSRDLQQVVDSFQSKLRSEDKASTLVSDLHNVELEDELCPKIINFLGLSISVAEAKAAFRSSIAKMNSQSRQIINRQRIDIWKRDELIAALPAADCPNITYNPNTDKLTLSLESKVSTSISDTLPIVVILKNDSIDDVVEQVNTFIQFEAKIRSQESLSNGFLALRLIIMRLYCDEKWTPTSSRWFYSSIADYLAYSILVDLEGFKRASQAYSGLFPLVTSINLKNLEGWSWRGDKAIVEPRDMQIAAEADKAIFQIVSKYGVGKLVALLQNLAAREEPVDENLLAEVSKDIFGEDLHNTIGL